MQIITVQVYLGAKKTFRMQNIVIALKIIYDHNILSGFFFHQNLVG